MTKNTKDKDYRPCVGMMVINHQNQIFMARRIDVPETEPFAWQMPQGGIDAEETPQQAAIRELYEEIGTSNVSYLAETSDWLYYDFPPELVANKLMGQYKGQSQKWFLYRFEGQESDLNITTVHPEFSEWCWCDSADILEMTIPFKRKVYQKVIEEFSPFLIKIS